MRHLVLILAVLFTFNLSAQIEGGAGIITGTGDPNSIALLDVQDVRGEGVFYFRTDNNTYYGYNASLASGSRWYALATTDDQTGAEVTLIQQNGITGANVQQELEDLRAALASGGDAWGAQVVQSDITLTGDGTSGNELKVDTTIIATQADIAGLTNTTVSAGTGITVNQTGEDYEVVNAAPDQTVTLTDGGTGNVTIGGIYPNFTVDVPNLSDADNNPTNEIQNLGLTNTNLTITDGTGINLGSVPFAGDVIGTLGNTEVLNIRGMLVRDRSASVSTGDIFVYDGGGWAPGTDQVNDADSDPNNENQTVSSVNVGLTITQIGQDFSIEDNEYTNTTATSHTAAGIAGVAIGSYFLAANPNEMGIPPGTKIRRVY